MKKKGVYEKQWVMVSQSTVQGDSPSERKFHSQKLILQISFCCAAIINSHGKWKLMLCLVTEQN